MKNQYTFVTAGILVVAYFLVRCSEALNSTPLFIGGILIGVGGLLVSQFSFPSLTIGERKHRFRTLLNIHRPEETEQKIFELVSWLVFFFGSLLLFLHVGPMYVLLDQRLYIGLSCALPVLFLASFMVPKFGELSRFPFAMNVLGRLGFCIPATALFFSFALILNSAHDNSLQIRTVTCLGKRVSQGKDPSYYIRVKPWSGSENGVEVSVPESIYAETPEGTTVTMTTGKGRLGLEWIRRIDVAGANRQDFRSSAN